jgi:diaminohydroxyphosphoribosylaminopyrimidine deaminase / 5-amino-6-(5-phosphoribosylamino)uracil reductase
MNDEFYMDLALSEAWKFQILTYPNPAVGCLILDENGQILS